MKVELVTEENGGQIKYNRFKDFFVFDMPKLYMAWPS